MNFKQPQTIFVIIILLIIVFIGINYVAHYNFLRLDYSNAIYIVLKTTIAGLLTSSIFYVFVVIYPRIKEERNIKLMIKDKYYTMKGRVIGALLMLCGTSLSYEEEKNIINDRKAARFVFDTDAWYTIANRLDEKKEVVADLLFFLNSFNEELVYLATYDFIRKGPALKAIRNIIADIKETNHWIDNYPPPDYDSGEKVLIRTINKIVTGWSVIDGWHDKDEIISAIDIGIATPSFCSLRVYYKSIKELGIAMQNKLRKRE